MIEAADSERNRNITLQDEIISAFPKNTDRLAAFFHLLPRGAGEFPKNTQTALRRSA